jgi:hypothetical protein
MREVKIKVVDVRNPTHRVLKLDEPKAEEYNNVSSSDEKSQIQVGSNTELEMEGDLEGEEVKIERTTGEKVPERKDMSRTTSMDGKSNWSKAGKNYEFDATLKKTRNQLDMFKAPPIDNPRKEREYPNDSMSDKEVEELFEEIVDPRIIDYEARDSPTAYIPLKKLGMSPNFALKMAEQFYGDKGYSKFRTDDTDLWIYF